jgi:hypothetical protein
VKELLRSLVPTIPIHLRVTLLVSQRLDRALDILDTILAEMRTEQVVRRLAGANARVSLIVKVAVGGHLAAANVSRALASIRKQYENVFEAPSRHRPSVVFDAVQMSVDNRRVWFESWTPTDAHSFNLVLEDNAEISSILLQSSLELTRSVFYRPHYPFDDILGLCLSNTPNSDVALSISKRSFRLMSSSDTLRQSICDSGAIYAALGRHKCLLHGGKCTILPTILS